VYSRIHPSQECYMLPIWPAPAASLQGVYDDTNEFLYRYRTAVRMVVHRRQPAGDKHEPDRSDDQAARVSGRGRPPRTPTVLKKKQLIELAARLQREPMDDFGPNFGPN